MLTRRTGPDGEQRVTTRPAARPPDKIRKILCWALALALWGGSSWSVGVSFQCGCLLSSAFAVAPTLRTPPLLALRAGPIMLARMPAPPAPGCLLAIFTAITSLRMGRMEPPLTAFQKTASAAKLPRPLNGRAPRQILRWAHGRLHSRRSSLGGENPALLRGVLTLPSPSSIAPRNRIASVSTALPENDRHNGLWPFGHPLAAIN